MSLKALQQLFGSEAFYLHILMAISPETAESQGR
jgi:hypothetical protein